MTEYEEGMITVAVYAFFAFCISLPFLSVWFGWLLFKAGRTIKKTDKLVGYIYENEQESRKYHE